jgi:hypothetical protein
LQLRRLRLVRLVLLKLRRLLRLELLLLLLVLVLLLLLLLELLLVLLLVLLLLLLHPLLLVLHLHLLLRVRNGLRLRLRRHVLVLRLRLRLRRRLQLRLRGGKLLRRHGAGDGGHARVCAARGLGGDVVVPREVGTLDGARRQRHRLGGREAHARRVVLRAQAGEHGLGAGRHVRRHAQRARVGLPLRRLPLHDGDGHVVRRARVKQADLRGLGGR